MKCYICDKPLSVTDLPLGASIVHQPHEGVRHGDCDPVEHGPEQPAMTWDEHGVVDDLPDSEHARHRRVTKAQAEIRRQAAKKGDKD